MRYTILSFILCLWVGPFAQAQVYNNGGVIYIPSAAKVFLNTNCINANGGSIINEGTLTTTQNMDNQAGCNLSGNGKYEVSGNWLNKGNFQADLSEVEFLGSTASQITAGGDAFHNVTLNKNAGATTSLSEDAQIENTLKFEVSDNPLFLENHDLLLRTNAKIDGYTATSFVVTNGTGQLKKQDLSQFTFPVGANMSNCNPLTLTEHGTVDEIGVNCLPDALEQGTSGNPETNDFVAASWTVTEANPGGSQLDMQFQWAGTDELPGFNRSSCDAVRHDGNDWQFVSSFQAASGSDPYSIVVNNVQQMGTFSVSSSSVLPLEWLSFEAEKAGKADVLLHWQITMERQPAWFELEKSTDGQNWSPLTTVPAKDNPETTRYSYLDQAINRLQPQILTWYYRLKIVQLDGQYDYSSIEEVRLEGGNAAFSIYPNPTTTGVFLNLPNFSEEQALTIRLFNATGQKVQEEMLIPSTTPFVDLERLSAGLYLLRVEQDGTLVGVQPIVKE